jgi:hypothetical protein
MPLEDLFVYQRYIRRRLSPGRRIELYLAQVCKVLMQVNGVKDVQIESFLFDPPPDEELSDRESQQPDADAAAAAMNFQPRKRQPRSDKPNGDAENGQQPG